MVGEAGGLLVHIPIWSSSFPPLCYVWHESHESMALARTILSTMGG